MSACPTRILHSRPPPPPPGDNAPTCCVVSLPITILGAACHARQAWLPPSRLTPAQVKHWPSQGAAGQLGAVALPDGVFGPKVSTTAYRSRAYSLVSRPTAAGYPYPQADIVCAETGTPSREATCAATSRPRLQTQKLHPDVAWGARLGSHPPTRASIPALGGRAAPAAA